jgi:hypothetical protein
MYTRLIRLVRLQHNTLPSPVIRKMASQPVQLTASERAQHIDPLVEAGWSIVEVGSSF